MPELPEVEHARRTLEAWTVGRTVRTVNVADARILDDGSSVSIVQRALAGATVNAVERRGKWLRMRMRGPRPAWFYSHLGMTGRWLSRSAALAPLRFERASLAFRDGTSVRYLDPRLFGRFVVGPEDFAPWEALGPDPLLDGIDLRRLAGLFATRRAPVKTVLLDQAVLAGVGNIQATEACFLARLDPRRAADSLSRKEVASLARGITRTIRTTLAGMEGETVVYVSEPGADNPFLVYGRGGEPCPRCPRRTGAMLDRIVLGGRTTVFCPRCQR